MAALFYNPVMCPAMKYSSRMNALEEGALLKAFQDSGRPGLISFSAGFPSTETYPVEEIERSLQRVMRNHGHEAMSYCSSSGYDELRRLIQNRLHQKFGLNYGLNEIIITNGSQQGLDMSAMLFLNPDDIVLFEAPTYLGAVSALKIYQANMVSIPSDENGINMQELARTLAKYGNRVKLIYVSPDYQNPTGRSWALDRRRQFIDFISDYPIPVLEDAAYSELSFDEAPQKPLAYFDQSGQIIYIGTFSKVFCPGLRIAWLCSKSELIEKYLLLKNTADLSSCTVAQYLMADYLNHNDMEDHIKRISTLYTHRRDVMVAQINRCFPGGVRFTLPKGGLYLWLELPENIDTDRLLPLAIERNVTFMEGAAFYPDRSKRNEIRLNFSNMKDADIKKGIEILAQLIRQSVSPPERATSSVNRR
ncbi:MAG: PLP-dependent aminotransferase family protein [Eubacteriales bacterium]|nr:PLP-dependent aminotransferase family protein [Eubacteriales bacterium]